RSLRVTKARWRYAARGGQDPRGPVCAAGVSSTMGQTAGMAAGTMGIGAAIAAVCGRAVVCGRDRSRVGPSARPHRAIRIPRGAVIPVVITKPSDLPVDRAAVFADLIVGLREYEWADPIVSECDEPRSIAPNAIDLARRHRRGAPWLLYMEDDVILGPDF